MADDRFIFDIPASGSVALASEIRRNLNALAQNNYTADETYPRNPRNGMFRMNAAIVDNVRLQVYLGSWRTLISNLASAATQARRLEQSFSAETVWTFDHNLGAEPLVQVVYDTGEVLSPATADPPLSIIHSGVNRVVVTHSGNKTGKIIVIG